MCALRVAGPQYIAMHRLATSCRLYTALKCTFLNIFFKTCDFKSSFFMVFSRFLMDYWCFFFGLRFLCLGAMFVARGEYQLSIPNVISLFPLLFQSSPSPFFNSACQKIFYPTYLPKYIFYINATFFLFQISPHSLCVVYLRTSWKSDFFFYFHLVIYVCMSYVCVCVCVRVCV